MSVSCNYNILRPEVLKSNSVHLQQYQSAIRAYKAGKTVNFEELPIPPGEAFLIKAFLLRLFIKAFFY